jgi:Fic family protein
MSSDRHTQADIVELIADPEAKANREAENGVRQYKSAVEIIRSNIQTGQGFRLTRAIVLDLHHKALEGIHPLAGTYRNSPVFIGQSKHVPPRHVEAPDHVAEMCEYVNRHWDERGSIHLAAFVLWRMNWIHPFADGNGRTGRVVSYIVLSVKLDSLLPGTPTIPDQIAADKTPYYRALEASDDSWKRNILALSDMEMMLERMLVRQLQSATERLQFKRKRVRVLAPGLNTGCFHGRFSPSTDSQCRNCRRAPSLARRRPGAAVGA